MAETYDPTEDFFDVESTDLSVVSTEEEDDSTIDMTGGSQPRPIPEAELEATIAALAAQRLGDLPDTNIKDTYDRYYDLALRREDDIIRGELVLLKLAKLQELTNAEMLKAAGERNTDLVQGLSDIQFAFDPETEKFSIVEEQAAKHIVEEGFGDEDRAAIALENASKFDISYEDIVESAIQDNLALTKLVKKYLGRLGWNWETMGQVGHVLMPFSDMYTMSQKIPTIENPMLTGNDLKEQIATYRAMSSEEKAETLAQLDKFFDMPDGEGTLGDYWGGAGNDLYALTYFMYLQEFTGFDEFIEDSLVWLDGAFVAGVVVKPILKGLGLGVKIFSSLMRGDVAASAVASGNRLSATQQTSAVIDGVKAGEVAKDSPVAVNAGELTLEGQLVPIPSHLAGTPGISGRLNKLLQQAETFAQQIVDVAQVRYLDPTEVKAATSAYGQKVAGELFDAGSPHLDILRYTGETLEQDLKGITYVAFYGDDAGKGFATAEIAMSYAKHLKLEGTTVLSKDIGGSFFLQLRKPVDDASGFITAYKSIDSGGGLTGLRRILTTPTNYVGVMEAQAGHLTLAVRERVLNHGRQLIKFVNKLSKSERTSLAEVLEFGRNHERWFTPGELVGRFHLTDNQVVAYHSIRRMDDINYIMMNSSAFGSKQRAGFKTINLKNLDALKRGLDATFDAKPLETIKNPGNKSIYDVTTGKYLKDLTDAKLEKLRKDGYVLLELEGARETKVLQPIQYIVGKAKDLQVKALSYNQLEYKAGGRVVYKDSWFVKQARVRYRGTNEVPIVMKSKTFGVGTQADGATYVDRMNRGLKVLVDNLGADGKVKATVEGDKALSEATGGIFNKIDDMVSYVGIRNIKVPFEVVQDGQELQAVRKAMAAGANAHPADLAEVNSVQRMISRRGSQASHRGQRLQGFNGGVAPVINPVESATRSLERAMNLMSHDVWRQRQADKFFKTFSTVLEGGEKKSALGHFMNPVWVSDVGKASKSEKALIEKGRKMQQHYRAILSTPTGPEKFINDVFINGLADIFNSMSKKIGKPLTDNTVANLKSMDPIGFIRSLSYNANLGLFNLKQPAIQIQATALMISANPVNGVRAAFLAGPMRLMLLSENPKTLAAIARAAGKVVGLKGDAVMELYEVLQRTGSWRMKGGGLVEQEAKGLGSASIGQKFLDAGQVPFLETERFNKIAAHMSAAIDWRKANPKAALTDDAIDIIRTKGEMYVALMNRVDRSSWQSGISSLPTQFWGYQARAAEMMLPEMLGGSKHFTNGQKIRMTIAQLAMYGLGGALAPRYGLKFRDSFDAMYQEQFGESLPEGVLDTLEKGAIESLFANALGIDVAFTHRAGLGLSSGGWGEVATKIGIIASTGEGVEELLKIDAAGMSTLGNILPGVYSLISLINPTNEYFATREQFDVGLMIAAKTLRDSVSSYSAFERAYYAMKLGMHYDKLGRVTDKNSNVMETILGVFGLDPSNERDARAMRDALRGERTYLNTTIKVLSRQLNLALRSDDFTKYMSARRLLFSGLDSHEKITIHKAVMGNMKQGNAYVIMKYHRAHGVVHDIDKE